LLKRRLIKLGTTIQAADAFLDALCGGNPKEPVFKRDQDKCEFFVLATLLKERAAPYVTFWVGVIDEAEADEGGGLQIMASDVPPWIDDDDDAGMLVPFPEQ
jgi:hypothetical protein